MQPVAQRYNTELTWLLDAGAKTEMQSLPLPGIKPRSCILQPSHYTVWATVASDGLLLCHLSLQLVAGQKAANPDGGVVRLG
jgi:hypothetical protein